MRKSWTYGTVGGPGEQSPTATRPFVPPAHLFALQQLTTGGTCFLRTASSLTWRSEEAQDNNNNQCDRCCQNYEWTDAEHGTLNPVSGLSQHSRGAPDLATAETESCKKPR